MFSHCLRPNSPREVRRRYFELNVSCLTLSKGTTPVLNSDRGGRKGPYRKSQREHDAENDKAANQAALSSVDHSYQAKELQPWLRTFPDAAGIARLKQVLDKYEEILKLLQ